jgi:hypothetical protein
MWYNLNYEKLVLLLTPTFLRKKITIAFFTCLITPVSKLHYQWKLKRSEDWYKLNHTGQVCYFRKVLNDNLDPSLRRIFIDEGNAFPRKYIYTRAEKKPVFLGKIFIYQNAEYVSTGADFNVYVPTEIIKSSKNQLDALIVFYKLASKRYKIYPI